MDAYEELANAIVLQAVKDYRDALKNNNKGAKITIREVEAFFRSDWYKVLTNIDGEMLIRELRKEREEV